MPSKPPIVFPQEQRALSALGQRLRLARLRRKLAATVVAQRSGISRTSLYKAECGDAGVTLGTYVRVLAALGLDKDLDAVAADDQVGRALQDLALEPAPGSKRRQNATQSATRKATQKAAT